MSINYRKSSDGVQEAYFLWKKLCPWELNKQAVPFVAGWNAALEWVKNNNER